MTRLEGEALRNLIESVGGLLSRASAPPDLLRAILEQAAKRTRADRGILMHTPTGDGSKLRLVHLVGDGIAVDGARDWRRRILTEVLRSGATIRTRRAPGAPPRRPEPASSPPRSTALLAAPIRSAGRVVGAAQLERDGETAFAESDQQLLAALLELAAPLIEASRAHGETIGPQGRDRSGLPFPRDGSFRWFGGRSAELLSLEDTVRKAARTQLPVLLEGETGTGKSLLARILHDVGPRSASAFVTVFCPALEAGLVEAALFGHRRGAFTGADADRIGKVQAAEGGTLFLDEVGELPLAVQPKLLRLLHEKLYERLGDPEEIRADVRIVAATHKDLAAEVRCGRFRRDLYERLRFVVIRIPPLRERREDLPRLLRQALDLDERGRRIGISDDAAAFLVETDHGWPGNVREIERLAARLLLERDDDRPISPTEIERQLRRDECGETADGLALPALVDSAERTILESALRGHPTLSRAELAARLGISERAFYYKLRRFDLGRRIPTVGPGIDADPF